MTESEFLAWPKPRSNAIEAALERAADNDADSTSNAAAAATCWRSN